MIAPPPWKVDILNDKHVSILTENESFKDQYGHPRVLSLPTCQDAWIDRPDEKFQNGIKISGGEVLSTLENTEWIKKSGFGFTPEGERQFKINKANAELICRAVNNHAALVEFLEEAMNYFIKDPEAIMFKGDIKRLLKTARGEV